MNRPFPLLVLAALAAPARAHFLWATLDPVGKTVSIGLQEVPSDAPLPLAARAGKVVVPGVALKPDGNWLRGPVAKGAVGASLDYGVLDRSAEGRGRFWLRYYAKAAQDAAASQTLVGLPVELTATPGKDGTMVTVLKDARPAEGATVVVEATDGKTLFEGKTSELGTVVLPRMSAPLAVRAMVVENTKGEGYDLVRSYSTLNVGAAPKPFSRVLRDSFGDNHDVVSHSGFIETVMAERLTKAQLVDHLRQREIVATELDRTLSGAKDVPYGPPQREVLTLLRADLKALGADAPKESEAWPVTRTFLKEVREGAAKGPYFALGVFHVYYGGITNGGRDIGAMIGDQTRFTPTYYLKSDGYRAYLKALDALTLSDEAKAEAIRGGQAAYRYIIAVNDEPTFKAK